MDELRLNLRVSPKGAQDAIVGWHGGALKIKVRAAPEGGKANAAVIAVLADALGLPRKSVALESGLASRDKRARISGLTEEIVRARLAAVQIR